MAHSSLFFPSPRRLFSRPPTPAMQTFSATLRCFRARELLDETTMRRFARRGDSPLFSADRLRCGVGHELRRSVFRRNSGLPSSSGGMPVRGTKKIKIWESSEGKKHLNLKRAEVDAEEHRGRSFRLFRNSDSSGSESKKFGGDKAKGPESVKSLDELSDDIVNRIFREQGIEACNASKREDSKREGGSFKRRRLRHRVDNRRPQRSKMLNINGFNTADGKAASRQNRRDRTGHYDEVIQHGADGLSSSIKMVHSSRLEEGSDDAVVSTSGTGGDSEKRVVSKNDKGGKPYSPSWDLRIGLDMCSKKGDVLGAISLYDSAVDRGLQIQQYHYNVLLYLCASAAIGVVHPGKSGRSGIVALSSHSRNAQGVKDAESLEHATKDALDIILNHHMKDQGSVTVQQDVNDANRDRFLNEQAGISNPSITVSDELKEYARKRGFEIYERMCAEKVPMSEAVLTSYARLAMSLGDGDMAFDIVKQMGELGITRRLRSYGPALSVFCHRGDVEKAFEVEAHMLDSGITPEEPELEALLRVSTATRRGDKVYYLLQKLRASVRQISPTTAESIKAWFSSSTASKVGKLKWDVAAIREAIANGGGGWHGLGWLGRGKWTVAHAQISTEGFCVSCGEKLVTIDLDPNETELFARSVASIAAKREKNMSFQKFQEWLEYYGPFEAVVDAANVGLFTQKRFSLSKVNGVVNCIRQMLPTKKWPLIVIHNRRLAGRKMNDPIRAKILEKWKIADAIYATPTGSNDDWYWLYAAIKFKCLIVTNDEMRDHIFQLLGNDFFPKWKERHQVHFSHKGCSFELRMPPPYSVVIQESEKGHWHMPIAGDHKLEQERTWLCITRTKSKPK